MPGRNLGPVTDEVRAEILRLQAEGLSRNEIMRRVDRSARVVTETVHAAGLGFERSGQVQVATEARRIDLEARRVDLAHQLHEDAERLRAQLWEPATVYAFGGRDNEYNEHELSEPPPADKKALLGAAGMAIDRSLKLVPPKAGTGAEEALSMLGSLAAGIARYAEEDTGEEG
ncbi:helix-turn-helix domain-containing protein [Streptomyces sp. LS1784]|uniref:helix-turn-helix domain-containing protein n=1 Tax=Streptomyces sp. LS1784 TaxID=2851533 RepID=UPI001CCBACCB|nr:helix-turn-helix domain-containing protein [Streptomyces sp. LS1784]